jgi:rhodanese-related sulfurtransferase
VYCRSGARSSNASGIMIDAGFSEVYNLNGGIMGWDGEVVR